MFTASALITKAYYLSGIVSRTLQTVSGQQLSDGLDSFNSTLALGSVNPNYIPYYQVVTITLVENQEEYFIPNLLIVDTVTFNNATVRYATTNRSRMMYFGTPRANNIASLPFSVHFEPSVGGGNIFLYPLPNSTYPLTIVGKFGVSSAAFDTDLAAIYDQFYIDYLTYKLAFRLCNDNAISVPPQTLMQLGEYEESLMNKSQIDLTFNKISALGRIRGANYGYANLGTGYFPL